MTDKTARGACLLLMALIVVLAWRQRETQEGLANTDRRLGGADTGLQDVARELKRVRERQDELGSPAKAPLPPPAVTQTRQNHAVEDDLKRRQEMEWRGKQIPKILDIPPLTNGP